MGWGGGEDVIRRWLALNASRSLKYDDRRTAGVVDKCAAVKLFCETFPRVFARLMPITGDSLRSFFRLQFFFLDR